MTSPRVRACAGFGVAAALWIGCNCGSSGLGRGTADFRVDEDRVVRQSHESIIPPDARRITPPAWAKLEAVWGRYDPPFVNRYRMPADVRLHPDDKTLLLLGPRGRLVTWNRVDAAMAYINSECELPEKADGRPGFDEQARLLVIGSDGKVAIGFATGDFCVLENATGKRIATIAAEHQSRGLGWRPTMAAGLTPERLVTYAYERYEMPPTKILLPAPSPSAIGGTLRSWELRGGRMLTEVNVGAAEHAAISPDGSMAALQHGKKLRLVGLDGRVRWSVDLKPKRFEFASDRLLVALEHQRLSVLSTDDGRVLDSEEEKAPKNPHGYFDEAPFQDMRVVQDRKLVLVAQSYNRVALWALPRLHRVTDVEPRTLDLKSLDHFQPSRASLLFATRGTSAFDPLSKRFSNAPAGAIDCLATSQDARRVMACRRPEGEKLFELWDGTTGARRRLPRKDVAYVSLSADGQVALEHAADENVAVDWTSGKNLLSMPHYQWVPARLTRDGTRVAVAVWENERRSYRVEMRDVRSGQVLWTCPQRIASLTRLSFDTDERVLAAAGDHVPLLRMNFHDGSVVNRWSVDGEGEWTLLETVALFKDRYGKSLRAYDLATGRQRWTLDRDFGQVESALQASDEEWLEIEGTKVRRRSIATGADTAEPLDLAPSLDEPTHIDWARAANVLVVGTRRGAILKFAVVLRGKACLEEIPKRLDHNRQ